MKGWGRFKNDWIIAHQSHKSYKSQFRQKSRKQANEPTSQLNNQLTKQLTTNNLQPTTLFPMPLRLLSTALLVFAFVLWTPFRPTTDAALTDKIEWISFPEAVVKSATEPRKVLIDVYTEWCGWCKNMDKTTFQNPEIIRYINQAYYAVKLDAETQDTIKVGNMHFKYIQGEGGGRGANELAVALLDNKMSYPTMVFMDEKFNRLQAIPGYRKAGDLDAILKYFGDNHHQKTPWDKFLQTYLSPITNP